MLALPFVLRYAINGAMSAYDKAPFTLMKSAQAKFIEETTEYTGNVCISWPWACDARGAGRVSLNGRSTVVARLICERIHGAPPTSKHHAAHCCGNGHLGCVTPNHIRWATPKENVADAARHGTRRPHALSLPEQHAVQTAYHSRRLTIAQLARLHKVPYGTIARLCKQQKASSNAPTSR